MDILSVFSSLCVNSAFKIRESLKEKEPKETFWEYNCLKGASHCAGVTFPMLVRGLPGQEVCMWESALLLG